MHIEENTGLESKKKTALNRWAVFGIIFFFAAMTIVYVDNSIKINSLLKDIHLLEKKVQAAKHENEILRAEINRLEAPQRIISIARDKLGMEKPSQPPKKLP